MKQMRAVFQAWWYASPKASRDSSREVYLLGRGLKATDSIEQEPEFV
jgi:23S rRNA U2552 (ribose-2'-O)-methylase RlmE/FtsJ